MTKGSYQVCSPHIGVMPTQKPDNSFKSCLCTLLVVLGIAILLLLLSFTLRSFGSQVQKEPNSTNANAGVYDTQKRTTMLMNVSKTTQTTEHNGLQDTTTSNVQTTNSRGGVDNNNRSTTISSTPAVNTDATTPESNTEKEADNIPKTNEKQELQGATTSNVATTSFYLETTKDIPTTVFLTHAANTDITTPDPATEKEQDDTKTSSTSETTQATVQQELHDSTTSNDSDTTPYDNAINNVLNAITDTSAERDITPTAVSPTEQNGIQNNTESTSGKENTTAVNRDMITDLTTASEITFQPDIKTSTTTETGISNRFSNKDQETGKSDARSEIPLMVEKCKNSKCESTAARMITFMDVSRAPCENFYEFACDRAPAYQEEEDINIFAYEILGQNDKPNFVNKFDIFYKSCLNHEDRFNYADRIEKAKGLLHTVGYFQTKDHAGATINITDFVANLILFNAMPLFDVKIDIDSNSSMYILKLLKPDRSSLNLDDWSSFSENKRKCGRIIEENQKASSLDISEVYTEYMKCQQNYSDYLNAVETSVREMGFLPDLSDKKHSFDFRTFIEFEILSKIDTVINVPVVQEEIITRKYKSMMLQELEKEIPMISWKRLFSLITNNTANENTKVLVHDLEYLKGVFGVFSNSTQNRSWNNAFLAILANSLFQNIVLPTHRHSRTEYCKESSRKLMPDIVNYIYQKHIPVESILKSNEHIGKLYETLKKNFNESLEGESWLEEEYKMSLRKKLDSIELVMPNATNLLFEENILEKDYASLAMEPNNYQFNLLNLMTFRRKMLFSLQGQTVTTENMYRHFVDITKREPVFFYTSNIVCLPYGLTKRATKELPDYIVLAQVGFPLAKIIGYSFDSIGIQYKVELDNIPKKIFNDFRIEVRDTIAMSNPITFGSRKVKFRLNKALSESERIAENTALRLLEYSFITFDKSELPWISEKYNVNKTFLLAVTQEFCRKISLMEFTIQAMESPVLPPQFRIQNIMSNSIEFSKEFSCVEGSGMTRMQSSSHFPHLSANELYYDN